MNRFLLSLLVLCCLIGWTEAQEAAPSTAPAAAPAAPTTGESTATPSGEEGATEDPGREFTKDEFQQVQPETIRFTLVGFDRYGPVSQIQQQMYSIPGIQNFIPYLTTPGLITYDLRYSGPTKLLFKALQDVFAPQYVVDLKELGEKAWEITMRRP